MSKSIWKKKIPTIDTYQPHLLSDDFLHSSSVITNNINIHHTPKISIVTISRNACNTIEQTVESVLNQSFQDFEYIIIDGGSSDGTVSKIRKFNKDITFAASESDRGISHAFNKGISLCRGDLIGIINADDCYLKDALQRMASEHKKVGDNIFYGNLFFKKTRQSGNKIIKPDLDKIVRTMSLLHPTVFIPRNYYLAGGLFREELRVAMDYELLLRFFKLGYPFCYIDSTIAEMQGGGHSEVEWKAGIKEVAAIRTAYGYNAILSKIRYLAEIANKTVKTTLQRFPNASKKKN